MDRRTRSVNRSTTGRLLSEVDETFLTIIHWRSQICILGFKEIITKDPLCFMSYYGLIRAASAIGSVNELKNVENRILKQIALCKQGNEKDVVREFKILLAIYDALVKEELKDFMLYLNRGIVYIQWWRRVMMTKVFAHKVESERASLKS
ncbi:hypothetical protein Hdeb2414_s0003g00116031 [Helianthus debilis subsp. tardiflorus]